MDSSETTIAGERCDAHPDRAAVGLCERCGRTVCLDCAISFRGAIRCERCAALELGEPAPSPAERKRRLRLEHVALGLLLVAGIATIPPWHRSGTLTGPLSAWSFGLDGWAALSCVSLAGALVLTVTTMLRLSGASRGLLGGGLLSALSALAVTVTLARAPEFFSATPAPFVMLGSTLGTVAVGALRRVRSVRL
ncbi:MAG: hypothetical protein ACRDH9_09045 [Actinomycetota bacterium]